MTRLIVHFILALALMPLAVASPVGFAAVPIDGRATDGGGDSPTVRVHNAFELQRELERLDIPQKKMRDATPRTILLAGDIDLSELANQKKVGQTLKRVGIVYPRSHTTLSGPPGGATLRGGTIELKGAENVIIRNLRFRGLWEHDPSGSYDGLGWDYIRVSSAGKKPSRHVWISHCDFGRVYDGQVDVVHGSDLVTISHCIFSGDGPERHKKSILIGHSSSPRAVEADRGRLNVTIHHCWFRNLESRCPRLRTGNVHFYNNLVENVHNATLSVAGGATLVENCVYRDCRLKTAFSYASDSVEKNKGGSIRIVGTPAVPAGSGFPGDFKFNPPAAFEWGDLTGVPYAYELTPTLEVADVVSKCCGPR